MQALNKVLNNIQHCSMPPDSESPFVPNSDGELKTHRVAYLQNRNSDKSVRPSRHSLAKISNPRDFTLIVKEYFESSSVTWSSHVLVLFDVQLEFQSSLSP